VRTAVLRIRACRWWRFALALGLNFLARDARLHIQQLQLESAQLLAARPILGDAPQPQMLLQHRAPSDRLWSLGWEHLDLQPCVCQFVRGGIQLLFQLCVDLRKKVC
jgi:hypothetical protein